MYFVSESSERLDEIIERAYVSSNEITKYDQILETFLRDNIQQVQDPAARAIETDRNKEDQLTPEIRAFAAKLPVTGQLQLLIGPVGAGKSLFTKRYYRQLIPEDLKKSSYWSLHGLRYAAARCLAEAGATSHEIAAITGHRTLGMIEKYTRQASKDRLAGSAMNKLTLWRTGTEHESGKPPRS